MVRKKKKKRGEKRNDEEREKKGEYGGERREEKGVMQRNRRIEYRETWISGAVLYSKTRMRHRNNFYANR